MRDPTRPKLPRHTPASDLVPLLAVEEDGTFVTTAGRYGRVLACSGINPRIQGSEAAELTAARFGALAAGLPLGAHLQLLATNRPLRGEDWVPRHLARYQPPPILAGYVADLDAAYRAELAGKHIADLTFHAVLTLPGPKPPTGRAARRFRRRRTLARGREAHARALLDVEQAADALAHALDELDIRATPLDRRGTIALVWETINPAWGRDVPPPGGNPDTPTLRHQLAQSRLVRRREYLRVDGGYETTLALTALPEGTVAGWLKDLIAADVMFRLALHITPLDKAKERTALTRTLRQRHGVLRGQEARGRLTDFGEEEAYDEAKGLLQAMAAGDLRTFRFAAFAAVRAATPEALAPAARIVAAAIGEAGATSIDRCQGWQDRAWQATLPLGLNPAGLAYRVTTTNLADTLPFLTAHAGTPRGHLIGFTNPGRGVVTLDPRERTLDNFSALALGKSGSGKTLFGQTTMLHHLCLPGRGIVFDHSITGHWDDLARAVGGQVHRLGLGTGFRIDPWALPSGTHEPDADKVDFLLDVHALMLAEPGQLLPRDERIALEGAIRATYREHSPDEPGPYERHLLAWLRRAEVGRMRGGNTLDADRRKFHGVIADRLEPWCGEGTYADLLDGATTLDGDAPLSVFNFAGFSRRPELFAVAMLPLLEHVQTQIARRSSLPLLLVMDEGWTWFEHPATARFVADKNRTGRHSGLGLLNISQEIGDYDGALGKVVRNNASLQLILKQSADNRTRIGEVFGLTPDETSLVARLSTTKDERKEQRAGAYLVARGGADSGLVDLWVTPVEYWLTTSNEWDIPLRRWMIEQHRGDVWAAVRALAAMTPEERDTLRSAPAPLRATGD